MSPISSQADVQLLSFRRNYNNLEQLLIVPSVGKKAAQLFYAKELYKISYFGLNPSTMQSGYFMTDHIPSLMSQKLYRYLMEEFGCDHGLMVLQKYEEYCDIFTFSSRPQNSNINNFYLNRKQLFTHFIQSFYQQMASVIENLTYHKLILPIPSQSLLKSPKQPMTRQLECCDLMIQGYSSREIGAILHLSPRTVEFYINILKRKFGAKNRAQLIYLLNDTLII